MGKHDAPSSSTNQNDDRKHDQPLQAVLLVDSFDRSFHPITLESYPAASPDAENAKTGAGWERPPVLCPLNNVPVLHHSLEFLSCSGVREVYVLCSRGAEALEDYVRSFAASSSSDGTGCNSNGGASTAAASNAAVVQWSSTLSIHFVRDARGCTNAGDALRELDRRAVVKSDPFILMRGDAVTNADLSGALVEHAARKKKDNSAIMTLLLKEVGGWAVPDDDDEDYDDEDAPNSVSIPPLRTSTDDLLIGIDPANANRILLWDDSPASSTVGVPCSFFLESPSVVLSRDCLDVGIDICSPDVLARFSDEFDYRDVRSQFVANSVAEEEAGLRSGIHAHFLGRGEYAARLADPRTYHEVSMDLLKRWCCPVVPDNPPKGFERRERYARESGKLVYRGASISNSTNTSGNKPSEVGRSTSLVGPLLLGPSCTVGESCLLRRSTIGTSCSIADDCTVVDSHLWGGNVVGAGAVVTGAILAEGARIGKNAKVGRGCVVGRNCVVGDGVVLEEFTRITLAEEKEEDDYDGDFYSGFGDDGSSSEDEEDEDSSSDDDEEDDDAGEGKADAKATNDAAVLVTDTITDPKIVGTDGRGRAWIPALDDDEDLYDDDSDDDDSDEALAARREKKAAAAMEETKAQSIGYDMSGRYRKWKATQARGAEDENYDAFDEDDLDEEEAGFDPYGIEDDDTERPTSTNNLDVDGMQITGRQRGVDVVRELRDICLEHETASPVDNLRIELNSFKFSQNATYADCCTGTVLALFEKMDAFGSGGEVTLGKLVASLRKALEYWGPLLSSICMGTEEERAIVVALESLALGGGEIGVALMKEPAFRFVLQTLHDQEIVGEEAIFEWAAERKKEKDAEEEGGSTLSARMTLFCQKPTQDFLEWLEEEGSEDDDDSSGSDSGDDDDDSE